MWFSCRSAMLHWNPCTEYPDVPTWNHYAESTLFRKYLFLSSAEAVMSYYFPPTLTWEKGRRATLLQCRKEEREMPFTIYHNREKSKVVLISLHSARALSFHPCSMEQPKKKIISFMYMGLIMKNILSFISEESVIYVKIVNFLLVPAWRQPPPIRNYRRSGILLIGRAAYAKR